MMMSGPGRPGSKKLRIENSTHFAMCNPGNLVWNYDTFSAVQLRKADFKPRAPIRNRFCWEGSQDS